MLQFQSLVLAVYDIVGTDSWIKQGSSLSKRNVLGNGKSPVSWDINVAAELFSWWIVRVLSIFAEILFTVPADFAVFAALSDQSNSNDITNFSHADFGSNCIDNSNDLLSAGMGFVGEVLMSDSEVQDSNSNFIIEEWGMFETDKGKFETWALSGSPGHSFSCSSFNKCTLIVYLIAHVQLDLYFV